MARGNTPTNPGAPAPVPAPANQPAANPPAGGGQVPPTATNPAANTAPQPADPGNNNHHWTDSLWVLLGLLIAFFLFAIFGFWAYHHRQWGWAMAFGLMGTGTLVLILGWLGARNERRREVAATAASATAAAPAAPPAPAPAGALPACGLHVGSWQTVGACQFFLDTAGILWRNDPTGPVRVN